MSGKAIPDCGQTGTRSSPLPPKHGFCRLQHAGSCPARIEPRSLIAAMLRDEEKTVSQRVVEIVAFPCCCSGQISVMQGLRRGIDGHPEAHAPCALAPVGDLTGKEKPFIERTHSFPRGPARNHCRAHDVVRLRVALRPGATSISGVLYSGLPPLADVPAPGIHDLPVALLLHDKRTGCRQMIDFIERFEKPAEIWWRGVPGRRNTNTGHAYFARESEN